MTKKQMKQEMFREFCRGDMNLVVQRSVSVIKLAEIHLLGEKEVTFIDGVIFFRFERDIAGWARIRTVRWMIRR